MTKSELLKGYKLEIAYQKHMIENLNRWLTLFFIVVSLGLLMSYFFHETNLLLFVIGCVLIFIGAIGMLLFGYGIYRGKQNIEKVIGDLEFRLPNFKFKLASL